MKKIALILLCLYITTNLAAQTKSENEETALQLLQKNRKALGFTNDDFRNIKVQNSYYEKQLQAQLVYILQTHKNLIIHNQYQVLAFKDGILVNQSGGRIKTPNLNFPDATPVVDAQTAVITAIEDSKIPAAIALRLKTFSENGTFVAFEDQSVSDQDISAELMWVPSRTSNEIFLCWQITLVPKRNSDYWQIRINAHNNQIIDKTNLTVYCKWDDPHHANLPFHEQVEMGSSVPGNTEVTAKPNIPEIINGASYRVVPFPAESPAHPGGTPTLVSDPWTAASGNASSLKWHSNGNSDYTFTRGNNVWAKEDRAGSNSNANSPANSSTSDPLNFDFTPDFSIDPTQVSPVANQQFNITNLFYWNNIMHDISYQYGFDEPAANFQANNQGRGGNGNDFVYADAQDGTGTNNANFTVPPDGINGRMQMYLWGGSPRRDGDVDNGVIAHEYAHGISNRLTGGGSSGCLNSAEQMGEGWSDYIALMVTQNWATSSLSDGFSKPRGIATYLVGQSNTGSGIRSQRYCTNLAVNNKMFTANLPSVQHDRGEIWCAVLWDMTWNIIQQTGIINPNLYDADAAGGNSIAMKLVMQGMKLQPCDPGFLDGRNAILAADQLLYGGLYRCAIVTAFARRGMGFNASQGSAYSLTDQVQGFATEEASMTLSQSVTQQSEGQQVTYTHTVTAGNCGNINNYILRDTLPVNISYVSGGAYDAATRVVSFPVNVNAGNTMSYAYTVGINTGSFYPTEILLNETVAGNTVPAGWSTSSISTLHWVSSAAAAHSPANSLFANDNGTLSDFFISTPNIAMGANASTLQFWHAYNTEETWDGGVVEISTNNGSTWTDLGNRMIENPYNQMMDVGNALTGRGAFTGNSNGFIRTSILLDDYANQNVRIRFRFASDDNTGEEGWYVDDILMKKEARVNIRSTLFNATNKIVAQKDTFTLIVEDPLACTPVQITTEPISTVSTCPNSNTSFTVTATGTNPMYQWEVSPTGCNGAFVPIAGANAASFNLSNVSSTMNNYAYRVIVSNNCPSSDTSICIVLQVNPEIAFTAQPLPAVVCAGDQVSFSITASGSGLSYQWQVSTDAGVQFSDITNANAALLSLNNISAAAHENLYRVKITGSCSANPLFSTAALLTVNEPAKITSQPATVSKCFGNDVAFQVAATGTGLTYQWLISTDGGNNFSAINGATTNQYLIPDVQLSQNGTQYKLLVNSSVCAGTQSQIAVLHVTQPPIVSISTSSNTGITPNTNAVLTASVNPPANYLYQWQLNSVVIPGANSANQTVSIDQMGDYTVTVTDPITGCTASSNTVNITESASEVFYVYPNPNNGSFQVRYYSPEITSRILNVYDSKGALLLSKTQAINSAYTGLFIDLRHASAGMYVVELLDKNGNRLAREKIIIR